MQRHGRELADSFSQGRGWRAPQLARQIVREQHHRPLAVNLGPGHIAACNDSRPGRVKELRRNKLEETERRNFVGWISPALDEDGVPHGAELLHGHRARKTYRGYAWNRL